MTGGLAELADLGQAWLLAGIVVFLRVGAAAALLPGFGERSIPQRVRLAVALAFTLIVAPAVPGLPRPEQAVDLFRLIGTETVIGLVFGLVLRLFVMALQTAGTIAAQSTSLSQILGGASVDPMPAMGHVLVLGGMALAMLSGLHVRIAEGLIRSYEVFPAGLMPASDRLADFGVARVADAFALAFSLAAPFVIGSFVYNLALGAINRAMPQLMVVLVGAPAITFGALVLLALLAPVLLQIWLAAFEGTLAAPFGGR